MNAIKLIAALLIVAGALAIAYGGFSYTKDSHKADLGPLHLVVQEQQRVNIPLWLGVAALVGGALLLVTSRKS